MVHYSVDSMAVLLVDLMADKMVETKDVLKVAQKAGMLAESRVCKLVEKMVVVLVENPVEP